MMKCHDVKKKLYDYTKSGVSARGKKSIEKHLDKCSSCREEYLRIIGIKELFRAELKEPPRSILRQVKKALRREKHGLTAFPLFKPLTGMAAAAMIAAAVLFAYTASVESKEAEISEFLYDSYNISVSLEQDDTNYMYSTDIFSVNSI